MSTRRFSALVLMALAATAGEPSRPNRTAPAVVAHEWGTFTSVAGPDGAAMSWARIRPDDLPCFVYRIEGGTVKSSAAATVRMETPVIYFYSPQATMLSVNVAFRVGLFTEWYPRATVTPSSITMVTGDQPVRGEMFWEQVEVRPGAPADFPREASGNHYYAARETDAAPLRVAEQTEKLLFYRGVGFFEPPYEATTQGAAVTFRETDLRAKGLPAAGRFVSAILLQNRAGRIALRPISPTGQPVALPTEARRPEQARAEIERMLTRAGLYPREAHAMVETWKDAWLEEGLRILYIVPRPFVDRELPLTIAPAPQETERVFLGRLELVPDWVGDAARQALIDDDVETVKKWDRFWNPIQQCHRGKMQSVPIGPRVQEFWKSMPPQPCPTGR